MALRLRALQKKNIVDRIIQAVARTTCIPGQNVTLVGQMRPCWEKKKKKKNKKRIVAIGTIQGLKDESTVSHTLKCSCRKQQQRMT